MVTVLHSFYGAYILALIRSYRNLLLIDAKCGSTEFFARRPLRAVLNALSIRVFPLMCFVPSQDYSCSICVGSTNILLQIGTFAPDYLFFLQKSVFTAIMGCSMF